MFRVTSICRLILLLAAIKVGFLASLVLNPASQPRYDAPQTNAVAVAERERTLAEALPDAGAALRENGSVTPSVQAELTAEHPTELQPTLQPTLQADPTLMAQATHAPAAPASSMATATPTASPLAPMEDALAQASSHTAFGSSRLLGSSVAYAADLAPVPPAIPAPNVRSVPGVQPSAQPYVPDAQVARPDDAVVPTPPAPSVKPYVSRDSAAQKQAELNRQEQELLALQQQMEHRMTELHGLEGRLQNMLQQATTAQDGKFKQLVDMYANMKPRQAAAALTTIDAEVAVKILTGMKSKQSGEILSYMDPKHAAKLSEFLAKMQM